MSDQLIVEPEARLLVELGQERGVVYEEEIVGLTHELDLDENDVQALRDELVNLGVEIVEQAAAPAEEQVVVEVEIATTNSLDLFLRQAGRYPLLTKDEEVSLAKAIEAGDPVAKRRMIESNLRWWCRSPSSTAAGRAVPGSDPGGRAGPEPCGREVRLAPRPEVLHVRHVVDPPGRAAVDREQRADDPPARSRVRPAARDRAGAPLARGQPGPRADRRGDRPAAELSEDAVAETLGLARKTVSLHEPVGEDGDSELGDMIADPDAGNPEELAEAQLRHEKLREGLAGWASASG
jgi:RNA polymerase primary sigma factor